MRAECKLSFIVRSQLLFNSSRIGFKGVDYIRVKLSSMSDSRDEGGH